MAVDDQKATRAKTEAAGTTEEIRLVRTGGRSMFCPEESLK